MSKHGAPEFIRSDNGPEFIAKIIQRWLKDNGIKTIYIDLGCPWQNGYAESFNSRFRRECLDREVIYTLSEGRVVIDDWRHYYNHVRPHRSLRLLPPSVYARTPNVQSIGSLRPTGSSHRCFEISNKLQDQPSENISSDLD